MATRDEARAELVRSCYDNNRFPQNTWIYLRAFRFIEGDPGW